MARTLGSEASDQVTEPGRRVLIGWTGPSDVYNSGSAQSLPRDLSLLPDRSLAAGQLLPQVLCRRLRSKLPFVEYMC